jgi:hypothetical protein
MKKNVFFSIALFAPISCTEDSSLVFYEDNFTMEENAIIEVNIPKADGASEEANSINAHLEDYVLTALVLNKNTTRVTTIKEAAENFNAEFLTFSSNLDDVAQPWEAFIDGEIILESPEIISIALNTYLNTGGVHGNSVISFLNFNPSNGDLYDYEDISDQLDNLRILVAKHFKKTILEQIDSMDSLTNYNVNLPESLGFSEDGLVVVYNQHELEDFSLKMLEFTIPYDEVIDFLNLNF